MEKIFYFIMIFLAVLGIAGGIGYTIYCKAHPVSIGLVACGYMVYPKVVEYYKKLIE